MNIKLTKNKRHQNRLATFSILFLTTLLASFFIFLLKIIYTSKKTNNEEQFDILNESGIVVSKAPRSVCHNGSKILHPVIHIHYINQQKQIALQKRSMKKEIQPGKWDTSVGGHLTSGENAISAAIREAEEETGIIINPKKLKLLGTYIFESKIEREYVHCYSYITNGPFICEKNQVDEICFFNNEEIQKMIIKDVVSENFIIEYSRYFNKKFSSTLL